MPPAVAVFVFAAGTLWLFLLDRDRGARTSPALWLPVAWIALGGTRAISEWFAPPVFPIPDVYLEGSPLDRAVLMALLAAGLGVLVARGQKSANILQKNAPLLLFFLYCAVSALWSDFPFVTLKRWTKALGNVVMVLVILTDRDPAASVKKVLTWTAFLLIPSSVLLIKYYPALGRYYDPWLGTAFYTGVTVDKNMLGSLCIVLGMGLLWRFLELVREPAGQQGKLVAVGTVLAMILWLFSKANSATALACFMLGSTLIAILSLSRRAQPVLVHLTVVAMAFVALGIWVFPGTFAFLVGSFGRDTTLTGRTELWSDLLKMDTNPWLGAGFESFFLGARLRLLWSKYWFHPNEAHNGYLETYLTLGAVGLCLLAVLMLTGYRNAIQAYRRDPRSGSLRVAFLVIASVYNITEAAFKVMHPLWILFLLAATAVPATERQEQRKPEPKRRDRGRRPAVRRPVASVPPRPSRTAVLPR